MSAIKLYLLNRDGTTIYKTDPESSRLIRTDAHRRNSIILENVTPIFDGMVTSDGISHFVIQETSGSLVYLRSENDEWKKYEIFRSKHRLPVIKKIVLAGNPEHMCAFYCMEHNGKKLLVRHYFSADNLYAMPVVEGILDARCDFHLCTCKKGTDLFYRDISGSHLHISYDIRFRKLSRETVIADKNVIFMRTAYCSSGTYRAYTTPLKGYNAILFANTRTTDEPHIITFGVSRNCIPYICASGSDIYIQWYENGRIMQSVSHNNGKAFTSPVPRKNGSEFAKVKSSLNSDEYSIDVCAVCEEEISVGTIIRKSETNNNIKERNFSMNPHDVYRDFENTGSFMKKLSEIESDVALIGTELGRICEFLEKLVSFKHETDENTYIKPMNKSANAVSENLSGNDIGEKDENNIKLFESLDPDLYGQEDSSLLQE